MNYLHNGCHLCAQRCTRQGPRRDPPPPAPYERFRFDLAQSVGVSSRGRHLEPCPPLVRVFDYRLPGENHHHRTPSYDPTHRARSLHRCVCGPVAEKILPHRSECISSGTDGHHTLRRFNRHLHGQSLVYPCLSMRWRWRRLSGADVVGALSFRPQLRQRMLLSPARPFGYHFRVGSSGLGLPCSARRKCFASTGPRISWQRCALG